MKRRNIINTLVCNGGAGFMIGSLQAEPDDLKEGPVNFLRTSCAYPQLSQKQTSSSK